ncbi:MAG: hypothetical protein CBE05_006010, partial [Candidatus Puniceispirillum sp. TMED245]
ATAFQTMTLMFQREVAERITAQPGDSAYGRLSILTGWGWGPPRQSVSARRGASCAADQRRCG